MIGVHFNKQFAKTVLDAIQTGKPIPAPKQGWSGNDMLTLAGVLYAAVFSQGPQSYQIAGLPSSFLDKQHPEKREAVEETFHRDIHDGIEFLSQLAFQVIDDVNDETFQEEVKALVADTEGEKKVFPAKGFKGHKDLV